MNKETKKTARKMHVHTGDTVVVISGKYKGAKGKVLAVSPKENKVIVEKVNVVKKHVRPRRQGEQGGILEVEAAIYASKVQLYCPGCRAATRPAYKVYADGTKDRVCVKCGDKL